MPRANLEGAVLKGCSMDERLGVSTNLEGEEYIPIVYSTQNACRLTEEFAGFTHH